MSRLSNRSYSRRSVKSLNGNLYSESVNNSKQNINSALNSVDEGNSNHRVVANTNALINNNIESHEMYLSLTIF